MRKAARSNEWEGMSTPSTRMWLGNIAAHVTIRSLYEVFGRFGRLTDAAVFPARIGPLGYAFVNFHRVEDAVQAYSALHNTAVPPLTGSKQLKMRFKPAQQSKSMGEGGEHIGELRPLVRNAVVYLCTPSQHCSEQYHPGEHHRIFTVPLILVLASMTLGSIKEYSLCHLQLS